MWHQVIRALVCSTESSTGMYLRPKNRLILVLKVTVLGRKPSASMRAQRVAVTSSLAPQRTHALMSAKHRPTNHSVRCPAKLDQPVSSLP
jgi:hypothetical protein